MSDTFLSQEEINSLLQREARLKEMPDLSDSEKDILGEVGNISMATSATTLSTLLNKSVAITTPRVEIMTMEKIINKLLTPYVILQVQFEKGLHGNNILMMSIKDASIIANLMMGLDGSTYNDEDLSELEMSAVSEAMNQMIGSASTAVSTMLNRRVDINPPITQLKKTDEEITINGILPESTIVCSHFNLKIEGLIDSEIMQVYSMETAKDIAESMLRLIGEKTKKEIPATDSFLEEPLQTPPQMPPQTPPQMPPQTPPQMSAQMHIQKPEFTELTPGHLKNEMRNIDLILDVPLEISVILGKTQRSIKDVLSLEPGSIVELNKYAEEPLDIFANGKLVARGEVVVLDEKFGIRINTIISAQDRVKSLK
ncbi:MAG: flagellar motor switch phosphatase FliY [Peptostreptococcales bacterium]